MRSATMLVWFLGGAIVLVGCAAPHATPTITGNDVQSAVQAGLVNVKADIDATAVKVDKLTTAVTANVTGVSYQSTFGVAGIAIAGLLSFFCWLNNRNLVGLLRLDEVGDQERERLRQPELFEDPGATVVR